MKALVCTQPGRLEYKIVKEPASAKGQAIIKIRRVGVCGTDLHAFEGTQPFFTYPRILGHELAGELVDTGGAAGFELGESVTFVPYFSCGECIACRRKKPNCCVRMQVCGVHIDGGMAGYLAVPVSSLLHGGNLQLDELALVEPLAIGAHGIRRADIEAGEFVLVIGAGPIGLGAMEFATLAGGQVIAMDVQESRLMFCRNEMGIVHTINAKEADAIAQLKAITGGDMPTLVLDATGSRMAINEGFKYIAHGGRYVLIGLQGGEIAFSHPEFHKREATLMSSRNALREDFDHVLSCIAEKSIQPQRYISHRVDFHEAAEAFADWLDPQTRVIKAMISIS